MVTQQPKNPISRTIHYLSTFWEVTFLSVIVGILVGLSATFFGHILHFITRYRTENAWLLWLLPLAGVFITFIYCISGKDQPRGTNLVIEAVRCEGQIPDRMAPLIFISTVLTHLFGGSAGREGAALQFGGSLGHMLGDICIVEEKKKHILVMCGMSAAFSALFGAPIAAAIFSIELASIGVMYYYGLVPCTIASIIASVIAQHSGISPERFHIEAIAFSSFTFLKVIALAVLCAGLSVLFCTALHHANHLADKLISNPYLRAFSGGVLIILMVYLFNSRDYLGAGMNIIEQATHGYARPEAFILKLLFTAVTLSCGFKGGEIVPAFFVGATFGCTVSAFLGLDPGLAAAIGMIAMFCGVTNCPITALLLAFEMFGFISPAIFLLVVAISYMLSGYYGLYSAQNIIHSKTQPVVVNRRTH